MHDGYLLSTYSCGIRILLALQTSLLVPEVCSEMWVWSIVFPPWEQVYPPCMQWSDILNPDISSVGTCLCAMYISHSYYSRRSIFFFFPSSEYNKRHPQIVAVAGTFDAWTCVQIVAIDTFWAISRAVRVLRLISTADTHFHSWQQDWEAARTYNCQRLQA